MFFWLWIESISSTFARSSSCTCRSTTMASSLRDFCCSMRRSSARWSGVLVIAGVAWASEGASRGKLGMPVAPVVLVGAFVGGRVVLVLLLFEPPGAGAVLAPWAQAAVVPAAMARTIAADHAAGRALVPIVAF